MALHIITIMQVCTNATQPHICLLVLLQYVFCYAAWSARALNNTGAGNENKYK